MNKAPSSLIQEYKMQTSSQPKFLPIPFASSGSKQDIPNNSQIGVAAGRASYTDGFPPLTRTPLAAGGVPPFGTDFNGVLNDITAATRWAQAGAGYPFSSTFNNAISGYPKGARIPNSELNGFWLNTVEGNSSSPEAADASSTGWVPADNYGITSLTSLSGSSITLTNLQASKDRIQLSGSLTANINLVVPAWIKRWEVINSCTGNFSVTVKTPAGTGVAIPAGMNSLIQGDGVNILPAVSPGSLIRTLMVNNTSSYTPSLGTKKITVYVVGGGGGGGGTYTTNSTQVSIGAGGGAGGLSVSSLLVSNLTLPIQITIGSAGTAGGIASAGGAGGTTSFGGLLSATGGSGGDTGRLLSSSSTSITFSGGGGSGSGGNIYNAWGGSGMRGFATPGGLESGEGGASYFTAGAGPITAAVSTAGGSGTLGSGGSGGFTPVGSSERIGGAGGSGAVLILEYA